jgi:hypothetical protein
VVASGVAVGIGVGIGVGVNRCAVAVAPAAAAVACAGGSGWPDEVVPLPPDATAVATWEVAVAFACVTAVPATVVAVAWSD